VKKILATVLFTGLVAACGASGSSSEPDVVSTSTSSASAPTALPAEPGKVTIGSANFPEAELLADVYAGALEARGVEVTVHANIGERPAYVAALRDGSIGAIPEYSGAFLSYLDPSTTAKSSSEVYAQLRTKAAGQGLTVTNYAPAQDVDTITVTRATAEKYGLQRIDDLQPVAAKLSLGAPAPLRTVPYGLPGLKKLYGIAFQRFVPLSASGSITQTALLNGTVDAADIFSTDPAIAKNDLVSLADTKQLFAAENVVPVFRNDVLTGPMAAAANAVSAKLDTATLRDLVGKVNAGTAPRKVADEWLTSVGL
jgi:osmoprotectant transport system substrate-binding protein